MPHKAKRDRAKRRREIALGLAPSQIGLPGPETLGDPERARRQKIRTPPEIPPGSIGPTDIGLPGPQDIGDPERARRGKIRTTPETQPGIKPPQFVKNITGGANAPVSGAFDEDSTPPSPLESLRRRLQRRRVGILSAGTPAAGVRRTLLGA